MAGYEFISVTQLYNLLNDEDVNGNASVTDETYLLLVDARSFERYETGHILFATNAKRIDDALIKPLFRKLDCIKHIVVYDDLTHDQNETSSAIACAKQYSQWGSRYPVNVLRGGYFDFSKKYSYLRSIVSKFSPRELFDQIKTMPIEINEKLYIGNARQLTSSNIKNLKIDHVLVAETMLEGYPNLTQINYDEIKSIQFLTPESAAIEKLQQYDDERLLIVCDDGKTNSLILAIVYLILVKKLPKIKAEKIITTLKPLFIFGANHRSIYAQY